MLGRIKTMTRKRYPLTGLIAGLAALAAGSAAPAAAQGSLVMTAASRKNGAAPW